MEALLLSGKLEIARMHLVVAHDISLAIARREIVDGDALPNDRDLSERHGASRTVIREAIQHLAVRRVLEVRPGSGTYVNNIRDWDLNDASLVEVLDAGDALGDVVHDLLAVRRMIECEAAALAAEHATAADIDGLRTILAQMTKQRTDLPVYLNLHGQFHRQILICSHNRMLIAFQQQTDALQRAVLRRHFLQLGVRSAAEGSNSAPNAHQLLVECIADGDVEHTRAAMLIHTRSLERVADSLYPKLTQ